MKGSWWMGGVVVLALVLGGCAPGGPPGGGPPTGGGPAGTVAVSEKEWTITFPSTTLKAGRLTFVVRNEGAIEHNFVIEAAKVQLDGIQPGQSKQVNAELKPGTYEVVCNIPGHSEAGMKTTITVTQ